MYYTQTLAYSTQLLDGFGYGMEFRYIYNIDTDTYNIERMQFIIQWAYHQVLLLQLVTLQWLPSIERHLN